MRSLIYLACPYSHDDPTIRQERFERVTRAAKRLWLETGEVVFSPITMSHPMAELCGLPTNWTFWQKFDETYINLSHMLYVLPLPGHEQSIGVKAEIALAQDAEIPIKYLPANYGD